MKESTGEKWFYVFNYAFLFILGLSCLLPLLNILAVSMSASGAIAGGRVFITPVDFTLFSYDRLIRGTQVLNAFKNSVLLTVFGVLLSMLFTLCAAYPLSKPYFYCNKFFTFFTVFTMLFGGGLIPTYLVVKALGLVNSYGAIWGLGLISTYNMLVMRTFFKGIPEDMEDAARIDGCGELRLLVQIILPLCLPVIATLSLFYAVGYWNNFMGVLIYITETKKYTLSVLIQQMIRSQSLLQETSGLQAEDIARFTPEGIQAAGIIVMVIPMMVLYPFLQKYFVKGVMLGSLKG